jgi:hypothetical protein
MCLNCDAFVMVSLYYYYFNYTNEPLKACVSAYIRPATARFTITILNKKKARESARASARETHKKARSLNRAGLPS